MAASQAGQEAVYLRALLRGFNFEQTSATEIWEDNASCIMMSENPANRDRTRHVDTRVHYLRDLVRDGHVKLLKCAGPQNVADAFTKSLPRPALVKHSVRQYMWGTQVPFSAFYLSLKTGNLQRHLTLSLRFEVMEPLLRLPNACSLFIYVCADGVASTLSSSQGEIGIGDRG